MQVRFILTREDLWHFLTYAFFSRRRRFLPLLFTYALLILGVVILNGYSFSLLNLWPILILLLIPILLAFRMRRLAARGAGRGGEHVLSLTPEGIRERTDLVEATQSWSAIKNIAQDRYNLYLITDTMNTNIMMAVVIPRRAFATPQDAEAFLEEARQYWMQGRGMLPGVGQEGSTTHNP